MRFRPRNASSRRSHPQLFTIGPVRRTPSRNLAPIHFYVSVTYTTLGYGEGTLPLNGRFLAPMIAMSGLFAFGWTASVMFKIVPQDTHGTPAANPPSSR